MAFEIRSPLHQMCGGVDLTALPGLGAMHALKLISEIGLDLSRWPSERHFTSWLGLVPRNRISGGKVLSSRTPRTSSRAAHVFRMAAVSLSRTDTALGAFYRKLGYCVGKAKAITATARKLASLFYRALRQQMPIQALFAEQHNPQHRDRSLRALSLRAKGLGLELVDPVT